MATQGINESGRSMVEMLGVLAIIGVLSMGSLAAYRYAVEKSAANTTIEDLGRRAIACSEQLQKNISCDLGDMPNKTASGYPITLSLDANGGRFFLNLREVPEGVCRKLLTSGWTLPLIWKTDGGSYATMTPDNCTDDAQMTFAFDKNLVAMTDANGELCAPGSALSCPSGTGMDCQGAAIAGYCGCRQCYPCEGYMGGSYKSNCPTGQRCTPGGCVCESGGCPAEESQACPDGSAWIATGHKDNCNNACYTCQASGGDECVPACPEGSGTSCSGAEVSGGTCGATGCKTCFSCEGYQGGLYFNQCSGLATCTANGCVCTGEGCPEGTSRTCPTGKLALFAGKDGCGLACYTCADDQCNGKCQNGSLCLMDGTCYCQNGWTGDDCTTCDGNQQGEACCQVGQVWNNVAGKCVTEGCLENGIMNEDGTCNNNACEDNSQCPKGQYCKFVPTGCQDEKRGPGVCVEPMLHPNSDEKWTRAYYALDWWSANNFCQALGKRLVNRKEVCDGALDTAGCALSPTHLAIKEQFPGHFVAWSRENGTNNCQAWHINITGADVILYNRADKANLTALCH